MLGPCSHLHRRMILPSLFERGTISIIFILESRKKSTARLHDLMKVASSCRDGMGSSLGPYFSEPALRSATRLPLPQPLCFSVNSRCLASFRWMERWEDRLLPEWPGLWRKSQTCSLSFCLPAFPVLLLHWPRCLVDITTAFCPLLPRLAGQAQLPGDTSFNFPLISLSRLKSGNRSRLLDQGIKARDLISQEPLVTGINP